MSTTGRSGTTPRFPAYSSHFPEDTQAFVFAQYACQAGSLGQAANGAATIAELFSGEHQPEVLDRGWFTDTVGAHNVVWLAYWFDLEAYDRWQRSDRVRSAWEQLPSDGPVGHWREVCVIPVERNETLHTHQSADYATSGLSQHEAVEHLETQVHDYWGAARDRIADSAVDPLEPALPVFEPQTALERDTLGRRVTVEVPGNVALIRTAQDWSASTLYREKYLADVKPAKDRGVDYLATHPDSGCIAARNLDEESADGTWLERTCTIAWFASLEHLMTWCRSHRTHLEIYASFFQMVGGGEGPLDVAFWHEVSVLPSGSVTTEYVNCHQATGFLPLTADHRSTSTA
ncbi:phenylacetaldoxime dehydratase family protein [Streptomyces lunaelactis]|uniref:phenylacetaldoxime dehydratase family protein n=1 Tax=Streptomyces lunaelactis TaxID=1535768 RepID=UPI001585B4BF|nr:phenylacetaldoxime dehydratase family protein [Streptomyces lunaelactis]NUL03027.1 phenylacetaldoxime dehydratase family protein [Streptomyces lunaelactis]